MERSPKAGSGGEAKSAQTSSPEPVVPLWRRVETRGSLFTRDENGRIAKVPDPEALTLPRPDVWLGVCWRDGEYVAVLVESRNGVDITRYEILEDDGNLNPAWEALVQAAQARWSKERYGK